MLLFVYTVHTKTYTNRKIGCTPTYTIGILRVQKETSGVLGEQTDALIALITIRGGYSTMSI